MDYKVIFSTLYDRLTEKYNMEDDDALELIENVSFMYMRLRNDFNITEFKPHEISWIKRACYEILERKEIGVKGGVRAYAENGYSWEIDGSMISIELAGEVIPKVGVISNESK